MLAAISPDGQLFYMLHDGSTTAETFCEFLGRISAEVPGQTIHLVADGVRIHTANRLREFLEGELQRGRIEVRILPAYSPELNPVETLWS